MPLPLLALAAGSVGRMVGGRMAASAVASGGSPAAGRAMQFGGQALQMSGSRPGPRQDHGMTQWAKQNPGEAAIAAGTGAVRMLTSSGLADSANRDFSSVIQTSQFRPQ